MFLQSPKAPKDTWKIVEKSIIESISKNEERGWYKEKCHSKGQEVATNGYVCNEVSLYIYVVIL